MPLRRILGSALDHAMRMSLRCVVFALPHSLIHSFIWSSGTWTPGSLRFPSLHAKVVVVHGCVPAFLTDRIAALRISRTWLGAAPEMHAPYCCCGRTPVRYNFDARWLALTKVCTRLDLTAPLMNLLARELTDLLAPQPELTPRSSAEVTAVTVWPARASARAALHARSLLLALITDFAEMVNQLLTKPVEMLNPALTARCIAALAVSPIISWLTSSTCWLVVAVACSCV